jgi:hypothetical protein
MPLDRDDVSRLDSLGESQIAPSRTRDSCGSRRCTGWSSLALLSYVRPTMCPTPQEAQRVRSGRHDLCGSPLTGPNSGVPPSGRQPPVDGLRALDARPDRVNRRLLRFRR